MSKNPPNNEFDLIESIQILAVNSREHPDEMAFLRKVQRWFSTTFHTPLPDVEKLPTAYILTHRYEHAIDNMSEDQYNSFKNKVINKEALIMQEDDDEAWMEAEIKRLTEMRDKPKVVKVEAEKVVEKTEEVVESEVKEEFDLFLKELKK